MRLLPHYQNVLMLNVDSTNPYVLIHLVEFASPRLGPLDNAQNNQLSRGCTKASTLSAYCLKAVSRKLK